MAATLSVPYLGTAEQRKKQERSDEIITIQLPVLEAEVENNDHLQADSCSITLDWKDTTLDTRMLDDGVLTLYMGNADEFGNWIPTDDDCVFIGHVRNPERTLDTDEAGQLRIECVDFTGLFLEAKPFGSSGIPRYSDTLEQAWRRICSQTPGSGKLADRLEAIGGIDLNEVLGKAVAERFISLSQVPTHPDTDAWAVWQQCVGMLGGISYIEQDRCVVTTATDYYTERDPPVFSWGDNIVRLSESRQNIDIKGGVGLVSFAPLTGRTIEVFYPEIGDPLAQRKLTAARRKHEPPLALSSERDKRHMFTFWGISNEAQLRIVAKRVWEQLSRQELSGKLSTPHLFAQTVGEKTFPLLRLNSGDSIRVQFEDRQYLAGLPDENARIFYLIERGYDKSVAVFLARNVQAFASLDATFYVDSVRKRMSADAAAEIEISFLNKIDVSRGAVA
jgi:hypothetical protein